MSAHGSFTDAGRVRQARPLADCEITELDARH
jgi:ribosomal protein S30